MYLLILVGDLGLFGDLLLGFCLMLALIWCIFICFSFVFGFSLWWLLVVYATFAGVGCFSLFGLFGLRGCLVIMG